MLNVFARVRVVLASIVTWCVVLATVLSIVADEILEFVGADSPVLVVIAKAIAVLGAIVAIIRRVTPVLPDARGLLPPPPDVPLTPNEAALRARLPVRHRAALDARSPRGP